MLQARRRLAFGSVECDFYSLPFDGNIRWLLNVLMISKTALCGLIGRTTCVVLYLSAFMICYVLGFVLRTIWTHLSSSLDPFERNLWGKCGQRTKTWDDVFGTDLHEKNQSNLVIGRSRISSFFQIDLSNCKYYSNFYNLNSEILHSALIMKTKRHGESVIRTRLVSSAFLKSGVRQCSRRTLLSGYTKIQNGGFVLFLKSKEGHKRAHEYRLFQSKMLAFFFVKRLCEIAEEFSHDHVCKCVILRPCCLQFSLGGMQIWLVGDDGEDALDDRD